MCPTRNRADDEYFNPEGLNCSVVVMYIAPRLLMRQLKFELFNPDAIDSLVGFVILVGERDSLLCVFFSMRFDAIISSQHTSDVFSFRLLSFSQQGLLARSEATPRTREVNRRKEGTALRITGNFEKGHLTFHIATLPSVENLSQPTLDLIVPFGFGFIAQVVPRTLSVGSKSSLWISSQTLAATILSCFHFQSLFSWIHRTDFGPKLQ